MDDAKFWIGKLHALRLSLFEVYFELFCRYYGSLILFIFTFIAVQSKLFWLDDVDLKSLGRLTYSKLELLTHWCVVLEHLRLVCILLFDAQRRADHAGYLCLSIATSLDR